MYSTNKYAANIFSAFFFWRFNIKLYNQWQNIKRSVQEWEQLESYFSS